MDVALCPSTRVSRSDPDHRDHYARFVNQNFHIDTTFVWCTRFQSCRNTWVSWTTRTFTTWYETLLLCAECKRKGYYSDVWRHESKQRPSLRCIDKRVDMVWENHVLRFRTINGITSDPRRIHLDRPYIVDR